MNCEELLAILSKYIDGEVDSSICKDFEQDLHGCNPCKVVVDNVRKTITLYKDQEPYEMPPEFHNRLHSVLRKKWDEKYKL